MDEMKDSDWARVSSNDRPSTLTLDWVSLGQAMAERPFAPSSVSSLAGALAGWGGLASDVLLSNVVAYLVSTFVSLSSVVFLNASHSFVLTAVVGVPVKHIGRLNGSLVLLDEFLALPLVLIWGRIADLYGCRLVTVIGHLIVAVSFSIFVQSRATYQLFVSRAIISIGFAALTTMISAILASMTSARLRRAIPAEHRPLLSDQADPPTSDVMPHVSKAIRTASQRSARLSGVVGLTSGLGALFAVFVLLRLPPYFAELTNYSAREAFRFGVQATFYLASLIALSAAVFSFFGLRRTGEETWSLGTAVDRQPASSWGDSLRAFTVGFELSRRHHHLAIAYAAGFSARAATMAVSAYIPTFVNQYYIASGKCQLGSPDAPSDEVKKGCHAAFALASAVTGVVQLSALLFAPLVGWMASFCSQPAVLALSNALGSLGFLVIAHLPTPHHFLIWPSAVILGLAQITGVVVSLSLCASCRWQLGHGRPLLAPGDTCCPQATRPPDGDDGLECPRQDISGSIAGVYSLCGGLGILVGSFGGMLADWVPAAPFYLASLLSCVVCLICWLIVAGGYHQR